MKRNTPSLLIAISAIVTLCGCGHHYYSGGYDGTQTMMPSTGTTEVVVSEGSVMGDATTESYGGEGVEYMEEDSAGYYYLEPPLDQKAMNPNAPMLQRWGFSPGSPVMDIYDGPIAGTPGMPVMDPFFGPLAGPFSHIPAAKPAPHLSDGPYMHRGPRDYLGDMNKMPPLGP